MLPITEIHPILVHFPIVFLLSAEGIAIVLLARGVDMGARQHWPLTATYMLLAGTAFAALAAFFGDIALDHAIAAGFPAAPLETHEAFALTTLTLFILHSIMRVVALLRRYTLTGLRGWMAELPGLIGIVSLLYTAYLGGHLVYDLGVNVATVVPH